MSDQLSEWQGLATPDSRSRPGVPTHTRGPQLSAPSPGARVVELTQLLERTRQALAGACVEVQHWRAGVAGREEKAWDALHSFEQTSFGGVPMAQYWCDLIVWEAVLNTHGDFSKIVEIGTWKGGFSQWLYAQCCVRKMAFVTFDAVAPERPPPHFERVDVFAEPDEVISEIRTCKGPVLVFCDGGNKPRELRTFAKHLGRRDVIAVHDWGEETMPEDVPERLEMIHGAYCESMGSITRFFQKKRA